MKKLGVLITLLFLCGCTFQPIQPVKKSFNRIYHNASGKVVRLSAQSITKWGDGVLIIVDGDAYFISAEKVNEFKSYEVE